MITVLLKILAFILGIKYETPEELAISGKILRAQYLIDLVSKDIPIGNLQSIWLLGGIDYDESSLINLKEKLVKGDRVKFAIPQNFNFEGDYIDFYQITTKDNRYFIIGTSDTFSPSKEDGVMLFVEIKSPYATDDLPTKRCYFSQDGNGVNA
jgi:hypothetical protein